MKKILENELTRLDKDVQVIVKELLLTMDNDNCHDEIVAEKMQDLIKKQVKGDQGEIR